MLALVECRHVEAGEYQSRHRSVTLEFWATAASIGTFVVIAVTAIAAVVQLRHIRSANKMAWTQQFVDAYEGPQLRDAFHFVRSELHKRLEDPMFRRELRTGAVDRAQHPEIQVLNWLDQWGLLYRDGVIDRRGFMRVNAGVVVRLWDLLEPVVAIMADPAKGNLAFQQTEYLTIEARRWLERHPEGDFPKGQSRLALIDRWREADERGHGTPRA